MTTAGEGDGPFSEVPWFSDEELSRLSEFLTGDSARDQRSFQTLLSTVTEVLGETHFDRLLHKLVDYVIQTTRSERGILLLDEDGRLRVKVARDKQGRDLGDNPPLARTVCEMVRKEGRPVYERVSGDSEVLDLSHSVATMRLRQVMCAALRARGKTIGVIYIDSTLSGPPHTAADLKLFHAQAGLIGMAIENHRMQRETLEAQRLDQELQTARHIQRKLLPKTPEVFGQTELAGLSEPTHSVGGDYFDYFPLDIERVGITVGDVSGHGVGPALIMSSVRANVRSLLLTRRTLGGIYGLMNRALYADLTDGRFVSLFICLYDAKRHVLEYQNAGHTAPLIYSATHETFQEIPTTAPALGIIDDISAGPCPTIPARKGDFLICYTDGVTEMHSPAGELFGEERIKNAVRRTVLEGGGPPEIVEAVRADLRKHGSGLPPRDDITLVAVRF